ncbi:PAS domain S-box protein [candidate division KSB1 bacterium]|nr:PAS domain S-box protein [candidate division KSB1 bacterium]
MKDKILIFSIAGILIFIFGFFAHLQYFRTRDNVIQLYSDKQLTLANQSAVSLESAIKERIKAVEVLSDMASSQKLEKEIYLVEYRRTYEKVKGFEYIIYIDPMGKAQAGYPANFPCPSKQQEHIKSEFLQTLARAKEKRKTELFTKKMLVEGKLFICLISPIFSPPDHFQGAILGVLDVRETLKIALKPIISDDKDYAWILDEYGHLIYHPDHEEMLLHNIFQDQRTCFDCHPDFAFERQMLRSNSGISTKNNILTKQQLIGYAQLNLENIKWYVAISTPYDTITTSIRNLFKNTLLLIILMIVTVFIGAVLINRMNTKRLAATKEIENLKAQTALIKERNAAESRYRILVEQSPDPIFLCTRKQFIMINPAFETLFGFTKEDVCRSDFSLVNLIAPSVVEDFEKDIRTLINARRRIASITPLMVTKNGTELEVEISLGQFLLGRKLAYQGIVHDVTKIRKLERERERKKHLAVIGEMAARIAHEIKNPLASIQTGIQLLESQLNGNEKQRSYYERLKVEIQRVDSILKGLLSYAREDRLDVKRVPIGPLVNRFQGLIAPTIQKYRLTLEVDLDEELPLVLIDEQKIEQVLWNICLNAIQASKAPGKIYLNILRNNHGIAIQIRDAGSGIAEENLTKLFLPFFSTRATGTGLGLAISKKIIDLHKGQLSIESKLNQGTIVTICLEAA